VPSREGFGDAVFDFVEGWAAEQGCSGVALASPRSRTDVHDFDAPWGTSGGAPSSRSGSDGLAGGRRIERRGSATRGRVLQWPPIIVIAMPTGTVDFFNDTGGYGFIDTEDADEDVFFHMEDVGGPDLEEGQEIEFEIEQAPKGPRATDVTRL
jgi:CspA family cold shock protein